MHTDPQEPDGRLAIYKRNPHLHIKAANDPIPKSHIAITIGSMKNMIVSNQTIFHAMEQGVKLIREEILERC